MSELAKRARAAMKAKAGRLTGSDPSKPVDASGYRPPGAMNANLQTGPTPVSRRQFRAGGKVEGEKPKMHAGRRPRKSGGAATVDGALIDRDVKAARGGNKHVGAYARGGHADAAEDRKLIHAEMAKHASGCKCARCSGGRTERKSGGGNWIAGAIKHPGALHKELHVPEGQKIPAKKLAKAAHSDNPKLARRAHLAETLKKLHKADGGTIPDGTRPKGGRVPRATGGRTKKGGMNVNIVIAPGGGRAPVAPPIAPPVGAPGPVGLRQGLPPPVPSVPPTAGTPPPVGGAPMPRKRGGRTSYPIDAGAGGGLGRLEKARAYG